MKKTIALLIVAGGVFGLTALSANAAIGSTTNVKDFHIMLADQNSDPSAQNQGAAMAQQDPNAQAGDQANNSDYSNNDDSANNNDADTDGSSDDGDSN